MVRPDSTASPSLLERVLGSNLRGELTLIYGEPGSGKTALALQTAISKAREGWTTMFIDADVSLSTERLAQLSGADLEKILKLIFVARPTSFHNLTHLLQGLSNYVNPEMALIVVDTITSLYRAELMEANVFHMNRELNLQLGYLAEIAGTHKLTVILTSQIRSLPRSGNGISTIEPVATRVLKYWSKNIIRILSTQGSQERELVVEKASEPSAVCSRLQTKLANEGFIEAR